MYTYLYMLPEGYVYEALLGRWSCAEGYSPTSDFAVT